MSNGSIRALAALSMIGCMVASPPPAVAGMCADANDDGRVTVTDGVDVLRAAADLTSSCTTAACDPDGNGAVTVADGVIVLRVAAALPVPGACEDDACAFGPETIDDNLEIPAGFACVLEGTTVEGNVTLATDASLTATVVLVEGNIQAEEALLLDVLDSEIRGDVQFERGGSAIVVGTRIGGNLQIEDNTGDLVAELNDIEGDLQAFRNRGGLAITFDDNVIGGNLQCKENDPPPAGAGNVVDGNKEDQCAGL